jgi:phosphoribosylanthranilate isomerase
MAERRIKLKICGMREPENVRAVAALGPDYLGFIFYPLSPRFVLPSEVKNMPRCANMSRVGVFVNEKIEMIGEIAKSAELSAVQLHGDESPDFCAELKRREPLLKLIKVFAINEDFDGAVLEKYEQVCDFFLFDTKTEKYGGSGKNFDWNILQKMPINTPFFLSGGIGPENMLEAIASCVDLPLHAIDLNSRVELSPGLKSTEKIEGVIENL